MVAGRAVRFSRIDQATCDTWTATLVKVGVRTHELRFGIERDTFCKRAQRVMHVLSVSNVPHFFSHTGGVEQIVRGWSEGGGVTTS